MKSNNATETAIALFFVKFAGGLSGLADMGPGQLFQRSFVLVVGQSCVKNVDDVQLGGPGGHGAAAEHGLIGGGIELLICQLGNRGVDAPGDGDDGCPGPG